MWKRLTLSLLLVFSAFHLRAENPPEGSITLKISFKDSIGLFNYFPSGDIPDTAAQDIRNANFNINGTLTQRRGVTSYGQSVDIKNFGTPSYTPGNWMDIFVSSSGDKIILRKLGATAWWTRLEQPNGATKLQVGFPNQVDGVNFSTAHYIISESSNGIRFQTLSNPSSEVVISTIPPGKYGRAHLSRLLVAGNSTFTRTVYYSEEDNAESFPKQNTIELIDLPRSDEITGLGYPLLGLLPIYTNYTTSILSGTAFPSFGGDTDAGNVSVRRISDTIGCIHHRTIKNLDNKQYFFSRGDNGTNPGIYFTNGISVQEASKPIRHFFDNIELSTNVLPSAFVYLDNYCLSVSSRGGRYNTYLVCVDKNNRFTINEGVSIDGGAFSGNSLFLVPGTNFTNPYYYTILKYDDPGVDYSTGNFPASYNPDPLNILQPISWKYRTKDYDMGDKGQPKEANRIILSYENRPSSFTIQASLDFGRQNVSWVINSSTVYKTSDISTILNSSSTVISRLNFPATAKKFKTISFQINSSTYASINELTFMALKTPYE